MRWHHLWLDGCRTFLMLWPQVAVFLCAGFGIIQWWQGSHTSGSTQAPPSLHPMGTLWGRCESSLILISPASCCPAHASCLRSKSEDPGGFQSGCGGLGGLEQALARPSNLHGEVKPFEDVGYECQMALGCVCNRFAGGSCMGLRLA